MEICGRITRGVVGMHRLCIERPEDQFPHTHGTIHDHQAVTLMERLVSLAPDGQWQLRTMADDNEAVEDSPEPGTQEYTDSLIAHAHSLGKPVIEFGPDDDPKDVAQRLADAIDEAPEGG